MFLKLSRLIKSKRFNSNHANHTNEPGGYLFGEAPGKKRTWYWWEAPYYVGMYGTIAVFLIMESFSPKLGPAANARVEAHQRLKEKGEDFGWPLPADYASSIKK